MYIYIVRHGETYGNLNGDGFSETDLTEKGINQVDLLAERFKDIKIDRFYTSNLIRAVKTAEAVRKYHKDSPIYADCDLLEYGTAADYCGLPDGELHKICPDLIIRNRYCLGEETPELALRRAKRIFEKIKEENAFDSTVFIVAHGTFNTFLLLAVIGFPIKENFNFSQDNTGVSLVRLLDDNGKVRTKLTFMNDTLHLGGTNY